MADNKYIQIYNQNRKIRTDMILLRSHAMLLRSGKRIYNKIYSISEQANTDTAQNITRSDALITTHTPDIATSTTMSKIDKSIFPDDNEQDDETMHSEFYPTLSPSQVKQEEDEE